MNTKFIAMIWAVMFAVPITFSQNSIKGTIKSSEGEVLPYAKVLIEDTFIGVLSDKNGNYEITNLKDGNYHLHFSYIGYDEQELDVIIAGKTEVVDVSLEMSTYMSDKIIVEAVRAGEKTPTTYTNLSSKDIEKQNFGQVTGTV